MNDLPEEVFENPAWHALKTRHRHFAVGAGDACRYPAEVTPFAAVARPEVSALRELSTLLAPEESVWIAGRSFPLVPELVFKQELDCLQMVLPEEVVPAECEFGIVALPHAAAGEMVALTDVAFPGFFRERTCEMGSYFGIREGNELVAMGGERLMLEGYPEVSGVCTHPDHRGKGYAEAIIWHIVRMHRSEGLVSWLHVTATNEKAIALYRRMGFREVRTVTLHRVSRSV